MTIAVVELSGDALDDFAVVRFVAARQQPYLAYALFALHPVAAPRLDTFAVDRWWRLYVDSAALQRWGFDAAAAVLVHEVHHVLRDHARRGHALGINRDSARTWNAACDCAINDDLLDDGLPLPSGVTPASLGLEPHELEEHYFAKVRGDEEPGFPSSPTHFGDGCGSGADGQRRDWELPVEAPGGLAPDDAKHVRRSAAFEILATARGVGSVPAGLRRWASDLLEPAIPWRRALLGTIRTALGTPLAASQPTFSRLNRRADAVPGIVLPGANRVVPRVAAVIDTSGSMSNLDLARALTEVDAVLRSAGVREIRVLSCDTRATQPTTVRSVAQIELVGGGGTDLRVGIDDALSLRPRPDVVLVFTDGATPWPSRVPAHPRVVAVVSGDKVPSVPNLRAVSVPEGSL